MTTAQPGIRTLFRHEYAARSVAIAGATILNSVNVLITTTILPSVVRDIGGQNLYAWNTTLYVIASIVGAALAPRTLANLGPRSAFRIAGAAFFVGALICMVAPAMIVLVIGRTVQGFGGGFLGTLTYAIIRQAYPEPLWPRAFALNSAMWGIATVLGPAVGGFFGDLGVWRAAFGTILLITFALALLFERVLRDVVHAEIALTRTPMLQLGLLCGAVLAVSAGSLSHSWISNAIGIVLAAILLVVLARAEERRANRLLPTGTLSIGSPLGLVFVIMVVLMIGVSSDVFVPYFLQILHGLSPLMAGYVVAVMSMGWTLGSVLFSGAGGRRARAVMVIAPLAMTAGILVMLVTMPVRGGGTFHLVVIALGLLVLGLGMGSTFPHLLSRAMGFAQHHEQALASTSMTTVQMVGTAFGAAFGGVITNLAHYADLDGGGTERAAAWYFAVFSLFPVLGFVLTSILLRRVGTRQPPTGVD